MQIETKIDRNPSRSNPRVDRNQPVLDGQYGFDILFFRSAPFPICTDFDLLRFRSARISICNLEHFPVCTDFDLHSFRSAIFGSAKISLCLVFDLHRFRSARISIYMYFDMQINFRSMDFSICKSNFDLQIFQSANQVSIYRFFHLQITLYYDRIFAIFPKMNLKFTIP